MKVKVVALKAFVSGFGSRSEGEEFDLSPEQVPAWVRAGLIRPVMPEVLEAVAPTPETAVTRKRKR